MTYTNFENLMSFIIPRISRDKAAVVDMLMTYLSSAHNDGIRDGARLVSMIQKRVHPSHGNVLGVIEKALLELAEKNDADLVKSLKAACTEKE